MLILLYFAYGNRMKKIMPSYKYFVNLLFAGIQAASVWNAIDQNSSSQFSVAFLVVASLVATYGKIR